MVSAKFPRMIAGGFLGAVLAAMGLAGWLWAQGPAQNQPSQSAPAQSVQPPASQPAAGAPAKSPAAAPTRPAPSQPAQAGAARPGPKTQPGATKPPAAQPPASRGGQAAQPGAGQAAGPAAGQPGQATPAVKYDAPLPVDESLKNERTKLIQIMRNPALQPADQTVLRNYYEKYGLARWTVPENFPSLAQYRRELQNDLNLGKSGPAHDFVVQLVLDFMRQRLQEKRPPVVRVNAMLAIGMLNQVDSVSATQPTIPLADAVPDLLKAVTDPNEMDAVKVAALIGLARHASLAENTTTGISDPQIRDQQVIPAMLQLATTKADPKRSAAGHAWMRALAIDVLGGLGQPGQQGEVAKALGAILTEDPGHPLVKEAAAVALGNMDLSGLPAADATQLARALAQMAAKVCADELARYEEETKRGRLPTTPGGYYGSGGYDMMMSGMGEDMEMDMEGAYGEEYGAPGEYGYAMPATGPRSLIARRRVGALLDAALSGLVGPKLRGGRLRPSGQANAQPPQYQGVATNAGARSVVEKAAAEVDNVLATLFGKDREGVEFTDEAVVEALKTAQENLEALAVGASPPAAAQAGTTQPAGS